MNNNTKRHKVGVAGFRGYSGAELVSILARHTGVDVFLLEHRSDAEARASPLGQKVPTTIPATVEAIKEEKLELVFLATPPEASMSLARGILDAGAKVIDLSGAFRLRDANTFSQWYNETHTEPALLAEAAYGLPEFYREKIKQSRLIANPGATRRPQTWC